MGCNCGKSSASQVRQTQGQAPKPQPRSNTPAAVTVAKPLKGVTQAFTLTVHGRTQSFGSRLEAEAARVRAGGGVVA